MWYSFRLNLILFEKRDTLLKKSMEYYFCLEFLYILLNHIHMVLHVLKDCSFPYILQKSHENRSGESRMTACQTLWGSKSKVAETHFIGR